MFRVRSHNDRLAGGMEQMSSFGDRISARRAHLSGPGAYSFIVGRDRQGTWIARETRGLAGGIFASRDAALHYAEFESDHRPGAVRLASRPLELKI
jgi:hypothetical protein